MVRIECETTITRVNEKKNEKKLSNLNQFATVYRLYRLCSNCAWILAMDRAQLSIERLIH